jgi:hypothetical protein
MIFNITSPSRALIAHCNRRAHHSLDALKGLSAGECSRRRPDPTPRFQRREFPGRADFPCGDEKNSLRAGAGDVLARLPTGKFGVVAWHPNCSPMHWRHGTVPPARIDTSRNAHCVDIRAVLSAYACDAGPADAPRDPRLTWNRADAT